MKLATRDQVREIDRASIEDYGIDGLVLMENAGRGTAWVIRREFPDARSVAVVAGGGNNAGDGFVVARHLWCRGVDVRVYLTSPVSKLTTDAARNLEPLRRMGVPVERLRADRSNFAPTDVVVDALLGTGLASPVRRPLDGVIGFINSLPSPVVSVDLPSGLDADTGRTLGVAVEADVTVTYGVMKLGLALFPGAALAGKIYLCPITTPPALEAPVRRELVTAASLRTFYGPRYEDTHKGTYGHLLVLAASPGKTGAATLAAHGALRVGTGLVTVGVPESLNPVMETNVIEAMTLPLPENDERCLGRRSVEAALEALAEKKTALLLGPGMSTTQDTAQFLEAVLAASSVPVVLDADALTLLASRPRALRAARGPCVLTPHPGEMGRLMGMGASDVQARRIEVAEACASRYEAWVVLKGARTVISSPDGRTYVNPTGNPGMATGGMGDVLAGAVGGLLAQGLEPLDACRLAVYAHGLAADIYAEVEGEAGMTAMDVADLLPTALKAVLDGKEAEVVSVVP